MIPTMKVHLRAALLLLVVVCSGAPASGSTRFEEQLSARVPDRERRPPPEAYLHAVDRERARRGSRGEVPCSRRRLYQGEWVTSSLPIDQCVRMLPRQRITGIWFNRFEVSVFWPGLNAIPESERPFWLEIRDSPLRSLPGERAYFLVFEGRRTMFEGTYGYGDYRHAVIVDRLISATAIPD